MSRAIRILGNSLRGMGRNRLRTFFMMFGTFIGVAALTIILAIGRGTQHEVMQRINQMLSGSTILLRAGGGQFRMGAHGPPTTTLRLEDIRALKDAVASVEYADPMLMGAPREIVVNGKSSRVRVSGHDVDAQIVWNRSVQRGAYFSEDDVQSAARVALIGETLAATMFGDGEALGQQIRIGSAPFRVIGILEHAGIDPHGIDLDNEIIIPISTMMRRVANVDYVMGAKLGFLEGTDLDLAVREIGEVLRRRHSLGPDQPDDFMMFTPTQVQQRVREANRVFTTFLPLIAAVSILVGGLVVANLMLMNVQERRAEIGLRNAIGARRADIRLQFLAESAAVTALGGAAAVLAGIALLRVIGQVRNTPTPMSWTAALIGLGCAIGIGILAGVAPARRAAALDPVETLR